MEDGFRWRALRALLVFSTIPILCITFLRIHHCWANDAYLDHVSGVWIALASDLCHGVFYRPFFGPLGYGGTRYFPLVFVLQAALMKLGGGPIVTGHILSVAATLGLMAGVYVLLRRLGVDRLLACCSSIFVLCSESTQLALLSIRGDVLPAGLVVWGLVACCGTTVGPRQLIVAAIFFALAFSAKVTAGYAVGAAFLFFWLSGRRRQAWTLAVLSAAGFTLVIAGMLIASHGRAYEILKDCLMGGAGATSIRRIPQTVAFYTGGKDLGGFPFLVLATALFVTWPMGRWKEIAPLFFLCAGVTTLIIFGSPGTVYNHLIDLHSAALILLAVWITHSDRPQASLGLAFLALAALLAIFPAGRNLHAGEDTTPRRQVFQAALQIAKSNHKPILAENPLIPILAGQTPYVLDPFMLGLLNNRNPHFADRLWKRLQQKKFCEVVLDYDPDSAKARKFYRQLDFGTGFLRELHKNYELFLKVKQECIFVPRQHQVSPALAPG